VVNVDTDKNLARRTPLTPSIRIGHNIRISDHNWKPTLEEIRFAKRAGFAGVQFPDRKAGLFEEILGASFAEVREALEESQLETALETVDVIEQNGLTPLKMLERNLPAIQGLGIKLVHWHLITREPESEIPRLEDWLETELAAGVQIARDEGFKIAFEHNDKNPLFSSPQACANMLERVPGLGFVCDLNHFPADQLPDYAALAPRITMLHISDSPLPELNHHRPIGLGSIDFQTYFKAFLEHGFDGMGILEIGGQPWSGGYGQDTDDALEDSLRRLTELHVNA
jgi:L-ribulose-5-phosphate 3-epimerase